jgi:hypothetical protein
MAPGVLVMHPKSQVIQIRSGLGAISNRAGNLPAIASFNADFIARNRAAGQTTVLVGCKDRKDRIGHNDQLLATEAIKAVREALCHRGMDGITILNPDDELPKTPTPDVVPFITYSTVGTNDFKDYNNLCFVNTYNVPDDEVRNAAFRDRKPSERPRFTIGRRRKIISETTMSPEDLAHVKRVLHRMEIESLLQAAHRVRFAVQPRTVVVCTQHDLRWEVGRLTVVPHLTSCRAVLGMGTTKDERRQRCVGTLRRCLKAGMTLKASAVVAGVSNSTARLWAAEEGLPVPSRGRPRKSA